MKVIPIVSVTDAMISGASIAEPDASNGEVAWAASTAYAVGTVRVRTATHRRYQAVIAVPASATTPPESDPASWLDIGPTNRWAMFTQSRNMQSVQASGDLTITVAPGVRVDSVFLGGLVATTIKVEMIVGAAVVYTTTLPGSLRNTTSWSTYFFGAFKLRPTVLLTDLPKYVGASIRITLSNTGGPVKVAAFAVGTAVFIGDMEYGATSDALNFSRIDRDVFGNSTLIPRRTVPKIAGTLWLPKPLVNAVRDVRVQLNAVPAVWSALDDNTDAYFDSLLIVGVYKQFSINVAYPENAKVELEIEEI